MSPDGVCTEAIASMNDLVNIFPRGSNERLVSLAFDSTMIEEGIYVDIINHMTGIDLTQPFEIIESKFNQMVSERAF
jgi:hypothetical protein